MSIVYSWSLFTLYIMHQRSRRLAYSLYTLTGRSKVCRVNTELKALIIIDN